MLNVDPDKDRILERYNPPLEHWLVDSDDRLKKIEILRKQIFAGASLPTYTFREENGRRCCGMCDAKCIVGFATKAEAWQHHYEELNKGCVAMENQLKEYKEVLEELYRRRDAVSQAMSQSSNLSDKQ